MRLNNNKQVYSISEETLHQKVLQHKCKHAMPHTQTLQGFKSANQCSNEETS